MFEIRLVSQHWTVTKSSSFIWMDFVFLRFKSLNSCVVNVVRMDLRSIKSDLRAESWKTVRKKRAKIVRRIKQVSKGSCNKISGVQSAQRENQEESSPKSSSMRQKTDFAAFFWVQHRSQRQNKLEMAFFVLLSASIDCLQRKFAKNGEEIALKGVWQPFFPFRYS